MIGFKFLFTFIQVAVYVAVAALIVLIFFFVVTWALRLLFSGFRVGLSDHWSWFRGFFPKRKSKRDEWIILDPKDNFREIGVTDNPTYWRSRGYIVINPAREKVEIGDE